MLLAVSLQVCCAVVSALVSNVYLFLVVRFLLGIQTTGELQAAFIIGTRSIYRATLCVSAVFAVGQCLSVRHVGLLYPTAEDVKLLSRPGSAVILVF